MRFDVNNILNAIMILTETYIRSIDEIADDEQKRRYQVEETIRQHDGQWTKEYCDQYRREHITDQRMIGQRMQKKRDAVFPRMMILLDQLHQWVDTIFDGMPSQDFANALTLYRTMGMKLSKHELELLEGKVGNYAERKLFNAFSEECGVKPIVAVPDIEDIMKQVDSVENIAKSCLRYYAGQDQILFDCIDQSDTMTPRNKITTMALGRTATDRKRFDELASKINSASQIRELTQEENQQVMEVIKSGVTDSALQLAIDSADYSVQNLIRLSDFGDRVKVIA